MESRYPSIFVENMWKYVTRRFRDTLERGVNDFGRCSSTVVNGAVNFPDDKNDVPPGPPSKWLSLRKSKWHQSDNSTNGPKWNIENRDRTWIGAITWEHGNKANDVNENHASSPCSWFFQNHAESHNGENGTDNNTWWPRHHRGNWMDPKTWENGFNEMSERNATPPNKWLALRKCSDSNTNEWSVEHQDNAVMEARPWGPPCKWRSFRRSASQNNGCHPRRWDVHRRHKDWMNAKTTETDVDKQICNDKKDSKPSLWLSLRKYCKSYHNNDGTNDEKKNFEHLNRTWLDAITWSGVAVLGWYTSQLIHFKLKQHIKLNEHKWSPGLNEHKWSPGKNLLSSIYPYVTDINKNDLCIDSISKIGKVFADFTPTVYLMSNDEYGSNPIQKNVSVNSTGAISTSSSVSSDSTSSSTSGNLSASGITSGNRSATTSGCSSQTHPHSHISDASEDDLGGVLNSIENRLGLASIENGQYQDGLSLLRSAAERNHAPAMYNLGLCYEKGLGVTPNEKTALELYKSAAALDHPKALFNLGIYYGQGRGGLKPDQKTAIRLLRLAAVQGQQDAIDALKYLEVSISEPRHDDVNTWTYQHPQFSSNQNIVPSQSRLFIDNINFMQATV